MRKTPLVSLSLSSPPPLHPPPPTSTRREIYATALARAPDSIFLLNSRPLYFHEATVSYFTAWIMPNPSARGENHPRGAFPAKFPSTVKNNYRATVSRPGD